MSGISRPGGLSERLRRRLEEDRKLLESQRRRTEELIRSEHRQLAESSRRSAAAARRSIESASEELAAHQAAALRKAWRRPLLAGLSLFLGISIGSWGLTRWLSARIAGQLQESARLEAEIEQLRRTEERLRERTWGVYLHEGSQGRYVVLPRGAEPDTGWTIGGRPSVKLSSK